ncbi:CBS domain-containing protein [Candidatus Electronema sp. JM]|uniref:CBS domain-containing protein n=1 Tax=Candidatus Electronema sp. JM TaxID=3401571 RepID=UPI003AA95202
MNLITTHINADFDGLASMIAARKLYPGAALVFAGSAERRLLAYLSADLRCLYGFQKLKTLDLTEVSRLIVVDTRQADRLDRLQDCLRNPGLEIHLYDHHPDAPGDLRGTLEVVEQVGSTTTIFARLLQERGIQLTPDEATLMSIGIHEDTGSFLYAGTAPADFHAAAWLLEQGAKLELINHFVSRELSADQVSLLSQLLTNSTVYTINAVAVTVSRLNLPDYADDFSVLVRRMMVMENLDAVFALVGMDDRLYLICRSRIAEVNAGDIARAFGGGGHAAAASAVIADKSIFEAEEELLQQLYRHVRPKAMAGELMSAPVLAVTPDMSCAEASSVLTRYNITMLPVVRNLADRKRPKGLLGLISRRTTEKAIAHQLGHAPVSEFMSTDIATLPERGTQAEIQELIITRRQRLIPIVRSENDEDWLCGVVTRTDLLHLLAHDPSRQPRSLLHEDEQPAAERTRNIARLMTDTLGRELILLLRELGETAQDLGMRAYAVGGFARDLLLQMRNLDIDVVIEGDGIQFAQAFASRKQATVRTHEKFVTATVILPDQQRVDVATARLEYYAEPAALPVVEKSSLKLDLFRRDFTVNAMAVHLNPDRFGLLVDYFSSQNDLKERQLRVLHNLSFVEDPTRIFRAVRFELRLDFRINRHSEKLIRSAVQMHPAEKFRGLRFFNEIRLVLSEDQPLPALRRLESFGLFPLLWPDLRPNLKIDRRFVHLMTQAEKAISWLRLLYLPEERKRCECWTVRLLALFSRSRELELRRFCDRFEVPPKLRALLVEWKRQAERLAAELLRRPVLRPSEIYWLLRGLDNEALLSLMVIARKKHIQEAVSRYVTTLRDVRPLLTGQDLLELGFQTGPQFKQLLSHALEAQLDGVVSNNEEALALARSIMLSSAKA